MSATWINMNGDKTTKTCKLVNDQRYCQIDVPDEQIKSSDDYKELWGFTQEIAKKIKKAVPCKRVGIAVVGLEVPHAHIHLIPLNSMDDLNFKNVRLIFSPEEYKEIQKSITKA